MLEMDSKFKLRTMRPTDSASIVQLITEFDGDMTTRFLLDAYTAITSGTVEETMGVVVEAADHDGLVGMGTVRFSQAQYNGEVLPLAFLDGLKVHQDFRGQGLGYQIANWRVQQARERYGDRCVIATGMLQDNHASRGVAKKWCREFVDPVCQVLLLPVRERAPKPPAGMTACPLEPHQFEEFAARQDAFFQDYNLYSPVEAGAKEAGAIERIQQVAADGRKPYRFFTVMDTSGNLIAGAQTWARGVLKADTLNALPPPVRVLNPILHLIPPDRTIREVTINRIWYAPGQIEAARFLWETIRWECRDQGTHVVVAFDPRDPAMEVVTLKPWHQPRPLITMAINGPSAIDREKLVSMIGRV